MENCVCTTDFQGSGSTGNRHGLLAQTGSFLQLQTGLNLWYQMNNNGKRLTSIQRGEINEGTLLYGVDPLLKEETLSGSSRSYTYSDLVPYYSADEFEFLTGIDVS